MAMIHHFVRCRTNLCNIFLKNQVYNEFHTVQSNLTPEHSRQSKCNTPLSITFANFAILENRFKRSEMQF